MFYLFFWLLFGIFSVQATPHNEDITFCRGLRNVTGKCIVTPVEGLSESLFAGTSAVVSESAKVSVIWGGGVLNCSSKVVQGTAKRAVQGGEVAYDHLGRIPDGLATLGINTSTGALLLTGQIPD
ncbi:MAG: hypothetical protein K2P90_00765, partial [Holosporales bacterium]|nr:hypothetical protein [Holosporales bacterium]